MFCSRDYRQKCFRCIQTCQGGWCEMSEERTEYFAKILVHILLYIFCITILFLAFSPGLKREEIVSCVDQFSKKNVTVSFYLLTEDVKYINGIFNCSENGKISLYKHQGLFSYIETIDFGGEKNFEKSLYGSSHSDHIQKISVECAGYLDIILEKGLITFPGRKLSLAVIYFGPFLFLLFFLISFFCF